MSSWNGSDVDPARLARAARSVQGNIAVVEQARDALMGHCCASRVIETPQHVEVWFPAGITHAGRHGVRVSFGIGKAAAYVTAARYCEEAWQEDLFWRRQPTS